MNKSVKSLAILGIAIGGMLAPTPAYAHGAITRITHYCLDHNIPCQNEIGTEIEYCDGHYAYIGYPLSEISWSEHFDCP